MLDKLLKIIGKYSYNKELIQNATLDSNIISDLRINSTRIVDIILDIEDEFDIEIEDSAIAKLITIKDLMNLISQ